MAGPGDEIAAGNAGRGHLRASHADREQVIGTLKAAFVQGMLAKDEFDLRVGQTFASRTCAELAAVTADLPAGLTAAQPPKPARAQGGQPVLRPGPVIAVTTALYAGVWAFTALPPWPMNSEGEPPSPVTFLLLIATIIYPLVVIVGVMNMVDLWREKRSGGRPPQRPAPGAGGQGSRRLPSADLGGQVPPADPGQQQTAQAAPIRRPAPCCPAGGHRPPRDTSRIRHSAALHQLSPAANLSR
ncbi:MAG TPA: DUF1707 domain-containing protein [Streptosporangiaceae bacterium]|nr:DUF1707 domain-containing protein [Streptosporangiaceae bacterium]HYA51447.1 DUF1707 domain-containing protein [Streptosporangiaceae bacterium]